MLHKQVRVCFNKQCISDFVVQTLMSVSLTLIIVIAMPNALIIKEASIVLVTQDILVMEHLDTVMVRLVWCPTICNILQLSTILLQILTSVPAIWTIVISTPHVRIQRVHSTVLATMVLMEVVSPVKV